jgi:hypothetical protein
MSDDDQGLDDLKDASFEDAWYELEGAYEVYGIGRCRFVQVHCRTAMLIGLVLLAKKMGLPQHEGWSHLREGRFGMPDRLIDSCAKLEMSGRYVAALKERTTDQESAEAALARTLEVLEWIRSELGKD